MSYNNRIFPANNGYVNPYNNYGNAYNPYQTYAAMPNQQTAPINNMPQSMNNVGFVRVQSEEEARRYPVAPGGSVTFIDENAPYCYTKSVDMSQLDRPIFKKFRLVEESGNEATEQTNETSKTEQAPKINFDDFVKCKDFENIQLEYQKLKSKVEKIQEEIESFSINQQNQPIKSKSKKESVKDE